MPLRLLRHSRVAAWASASGPYPIPNCEFFWGGAYHTSYWVDPVENLTVVYMTQVIPAAGLDDFSKVRELVYEAVE